MHKNTYLKTLLVAGLALSSIMAFTTNAAADPTSENVTKLKEGIVETPATWFPFVILFVLIGLALSPLGINIFQRHA